MCFVFCKQKTAYGMRIIDWSSDVCSSDLFADYFIRNAIFVAVRDGGWERWAFGAVVALSACSIGFVRFAIPQAWLVYPVAILYLSASLLIENRYSIIPFALWMALRSPGSDRA